MSGWKIGLAVVLLMAGIFGVTVISQLSPKPKDVGPGGVSALPPLTYTVIEYEYDPNAEPEYYYNRLFNGFLEIGTGGSENNRNWIGFVLMNKRPTPAFLAPASSCACAAARATTMPHEAIDSFSIMAAAGAFAGLGGTPNALAAIAWAERELPLDWFMFDLKNHERTFRMAGTPDPARPTWVLIDFDFEASQEKPPTPISSSFAVVDERKELLLNVPLIFKVKHAVREPFEIWPRQVAVGELHPGVEPRSYDVFAFSMTRMLHQLPPPAAALTEDDGTVEVGEPVPLTAQECRDLAARVGEDYGGVVQVLSAYRYPVKVRRQAEGQLASVGSFAREIHFGNNLTPKSFRTVLNGSVAGAVRLEDGTKIDLGSYDASRPFKKDFRLVADRTDIDLEIVPDRCDPKFVALSLTPPERAFGQTSWTLTATIVEQQGRRPGWRGEVVLRSRGAEPETYRIPMTGHGR